MKWFDKLQQRFLTLINMGDQAELDGMLYKAYKNDSDPVFFDMLKKGANPMSRVNKKSVTRDIFLRMVYLIAVMSERSEDNGDIDLEKLRQIKDEMKNSGLENTNIVLNAEDFDWQYEELEEKLVACARRMKPEALKDWFFPVYMTGNIIKLDLFEASLYNFDQFENVINAIMQNPNYEFNEPHEQQLYMKKRHYLIEIDNTKKDINDFEVQRFSSQEAYDKHQDYLEELEHLEERHTVIDQIYDHYCSVRQVSDPSLNVKRHGNFNSIFKRELGL